MRLETIHRLVVTGNTGLMRKECFSDQGEAWKAFQRAKDRVDRCELADCAYIGKDESNQPTFVRYPACAEVV